MIRISRIVAKDRITDLLDLNFVSKITLRRRKQGFKNPAICKVEIYLQVDNDEKYFNSIMTTIIGWGKKYNCNTAVTTASTALEDGFIKESAFNDFNYSMPKKYKNLCNMYSDEYFKLFNIRRI